MTFSDFRPEDHLTPQQLVERWKATPFPVALVTLARWRGDGRGPAFVKAGHNSTRIFYPISAVEAYEQTLYTPNS
jgi:hypothetical protein